MKYNKANQFKIRSVFFIFVLFVFGTLGCISSLFSAEQDRVCPTAVSESQEARKDGNKLIVVLIKEHPNYKDYAFQAFEILSRVLPQVLEPSDRVILMSMEETKLSDAVFFDDDVDFVEKPAIADPPIEPLPLGEIVLPTPTALPQGGYMESVATNDAEKYIQGTQAAATQAFFEYGCEKEKWEQESQDSWHEWDEEKKEVISEFMGEFSAAVETNKNQGFTKETSQMFEAVQLASQILNTECAKFSRCDLIIFSDFYDYRTERPEQIQITIPEIDVAGLLLNCKYLSECQNYITFWSGNFEFYGTSSSVFGQNKESEKILLSYIRR